MSHYQADREHRLHAKILFFVSNPDVSLIATLSPSYPLRGEREERGEIWTKDRQKKEGTGLTIRRENELKTITLG